MSKNSERVKASVKRTGKIRTSLTMTPEENALLERVAKSYGGNKKAAIFAALRSIADKDSLSNEELIQALKSRLKRS